MYFNNLPTIYPTGNYEYQGLHESLVILNHAEAVAYVKEHYSRWPQKQEKGGWWVFFKTMGQVKRAIGHLQKKFKFEEIENWK